jgi:hypothetical protein
MHATIDLAAKLLELEPSNLKAPNRLKPPRWNLQPSNPLMLNSLMLSPIPSAKDIGIISDQSEQGFFASRSASSIFRTVSAVVIFRTAAEPAPYILLASPKAVNRRTTNDYARTASDRASTRIWMSTYISPTSTRIEAIAVRFDAIRNSLPSTPAHLGEPM